MVKTNQSIPSRWVYFPTDPINSVLLLCFSSTHFTFMTFLKSRPREEDLPQSASDRARPHWITTSSPFVLCDFYCPQFRPAVRDTCTLPSRLWNHGYAVPTGGRAYRWLLFFRFRTHRINGIYVCGPCWSTNSRRHVRPREHGGQR